MAWETETSFPEGLIKKYYWLVPAVNEYLIVYQPAKWLSTQIFTGSFYSKAAVLFIPGNFFLK
jgi:hypothetical protein